MILPQTTLKVFAEGRQITVTEYNIEDTIKGIINWRKSGVGASSDQPLFNNEFSHQVGTTDGDWQPIGIGRFGYDDDYDAYLGVINDIVSKKYQGADKLDKYKATEWHRIALAITALGGDPTAVGEFNGQPIDLIADGTYNRGNTISPGRQGINGWIWSLIALDSQRYQVPDNACNSRQDFILAIMKSQLQDGGLALSGSSSDPDITAMAVQALSPYYNSELVYEYTSTKIKQTDDNGNAVFVKLKKTVKTVIDECLLWLSSAQCADGDYSSWGMPNAESTSQVIVALTALGIDPLRDSRFIKDGKTLLDGIMKYRLDNGGFAHSFTFDNDNPSAQPGQANSMASDQSQYALVALWRQQNGMRTLYDMRSEFTAEDKADINSVITEISLLNNTSSKTDVETVFSKYEQIDLLNHCYVTNYWALSEQMERVESSVPEENPDYGDDNTDNDDLVTYFSKSDADEVLALPVISELTTEYYSTVVKLFNKLKLAENKSDYMLIYATLEKSYNKIVILQNEIDSINAEILDKLHPFDNIGLNDKVIIDDLCNRYGMLSEYDRTLITHYEDLIKSKTLVDNLMVAIIVGTVCGAIAVGLIIYIILHIRKRNKVKFSKELPESEE